MQTEIYKLVGAEPHPEIQAEYEAFLTVYPYALMRLGLPEDKALEIAKDLKDDLVCDLDLKNFIKACASLIQASRISVEELLERGINLTVLGKIASDFPEIAQSWQELQNNSNPELDISFHSKNYQEYPVGSLEKLQDLLKGKTNKDNFSEQPIYPETNGLQPLNMTELNQRWQAIRHAEGSVPLEMPIPLEIQHHVSVYDYREEI